MEDEKFTFDGLDHHEWRSMSLLSSQWAQNLSGRNKAMAYQMLHRFHPG